MTKKLGTLPALVALTAANTTLLNDTRHDAGPPTKSGICYIEDGNIDAGGGASTEDVTESGDVSSGEQQQAAADGGQQVGSDDMKSDLAAGDSAGKQPE
jgi:hypothetical protein